MAEHAHNTPGGGRLPFQLIDLDIHLDGEMLRLCGKMTRLQDQWERPQGVGSAVSRDYWETAAKLAAIHPKTDDGFQMKAMIALAMLAPGQRQVREMAGGSLSVWTGAVAIVNDVLRGLPR